MSLPHDHHKSFAQYLSGLAAKNDRAALAALRRGLGKDPGATAEIHKYVVPWLPRDARPWVEDSYFLVASLFALWHQGNSQVAPMPIGRSNLGNSFAKLAAATGSDSIELRFNALLDSHGDDLPHHLRHAVSLLKSKEVPVDWAQLLHDILAWDLESRSVQRSWAKSFWGAGQHQSSPAASLDSPSHPSAMATIEERG